MPQVIVTYSDKRQIDTYNIPDDLEAQAFAIAELAKDGVRKVEVCSEKK